MDNIPDPALINSPNINSVLKPPKARVPLKDLMASVPEEDNTAARKRRVSFANVNKIKEFSAGAESMVVCQTPAYEEPFSVSSDSSYPSGVDGWTPAKGQPSTYATPSIYSEKENLQVQSLRMSTGMDLTSVVGNSIQNTRYSMNGMDLTDVANSYETYINQQSRYSVGMDLTNVVGHPSQQTRYSNNGMDLTSMANTQQSIVDHKTRFSMGMDFTNVIDHSKHNTRYSINGMDMTEAANTHKTFIEQRSARFSIGMDMTDVVSNSMKTMRYSCNDMDLTEPANPYCYKNQSSDGLTDDSDALELTDTVNCAQFSAVSPKLSLSENVLYSINNTKHSVNSMDMTRAAGSRLSTSRRKSSRYSLVNMDLTEAFNNSCDDLEFTQAIGVPIIKTGTTRTSVCAMDLTEPIVGEGVTSLLEDKDNMTHNSITGDELKYSGGTEDSINLTKTVYNRNAHVFDKENILPNQNLDVIDVSSLRSDNLNHVGSKLDSLTLSSTKNPLPQVIPQNTSVDLDENRQFKNITSLNSSHNITHEVCKQLLKEKSFNISQQQIVSDTDTLKEPSPGPVGKSKVLSQKLGGVDEHKEFLSMQNKDDGISFASIKNDQCSLVEGLETRKGNEISRVDNTNECLSESFHGHETNRDRMPLLNTSNSNNGVKNTAEISANLLLFNSEKEVKLSKSKLGGDHFEFKSGTSDLKAHKHNFSPLCKENTMLENGSTNDGHFNASLNEETMEISITENLALDESRPNVTEEFCSPESENPEMPLNCPGDVLSLSKSDMNMSIESYSPTKNAEEVESVGKEGDKNSFYVETVIPSFVLNDFEINHQAGNALNSVQKESNQLIHESGPVKDQVCVLSVSLASPFERSPNLSSSVLCNKNITMTRGRSKSFIVTPETSLETSVNDGTKVGNEEIADVQCTLTALETINVKEDGSYHSEHSLNHEVSPLRCSGSHEKRGKRSFEAALEPENDTEESPIKQICLSREDFASEFINNVTVPSFLMETVAPENETVSSLQQHEATALVQDQSKSTCLAEHNMEHLSFGPTSKRDFESKLEFSLRMDDTQHAGLKHNVFGNTLHEEVVDLCDSTFDATATDVRELLNNSRYKTKCAYDVDNISVKENDILTCVAKQTDTSSLNNVSFDHGHLDQIPQVVLSEQCRNSETICNIETEVLEKELEKVAVDPLPEKYVVALSKSGSKRKMAGIRNIGSNFYVANLIPNFVGITFSIDTYDTVNNVTYENISTESNKVVGEYLLKQAENYVFPEKGSDLIIQLQSVNKSFLARLARNINVICKYYNGRIKGNVLTLEVASCRNHFWTFIDVNIRHPQFLNQTDITISRQEIGDLKLSHVRKVFSSVEKNQDQLLNFAKALFELQYNN